MGGRARKIVGLPLTVGHSHHRTSDGKAAKSDVCQAEAQVMSLEALRGVRDGEALLVIG